MASNVSICQDTSDLVDVWPTQGLFFKPVAKVNVCVALPLLKLPGKTISNWEVMEKAKKMFSPNEFVMLKVVKSTLEFIRFEGEVENKSLISVAVTRLDGKSMKLSGFSEQLRIRCAEAKVPFPIRHDWDSFFRDAKDMNEMKPGERPDTVHFKDLPSKWFVDFREDSKNSKPSEYILTRVFENYGRIRAVDIPMLDPYRKELQTSGTIQTFSFRQDLTFEAFVQFTEYLGFVKCMTALKGMKLIYKDLEQKTYMATIKVDFDKTKHMSEESIKKRKVEREKLEQLEQQRMERIQREREVEINRLAEERRKVDEQMLERNRRREEKTQKRLERRERREKARKLRRLEKKKAEGERTKIIEEKVEIRKLLIAQRKLEAMRIFSCLTERVKAEKIFKDVEEREQDLEVKRFEQLKLEKKKRVKKEKKLLKKNEVKRKKLEKQEQLLRQKLVSNLQQHEIEKSSVDDHDQSRHRSHERGRSGVGSERRGLDSQSRKYVQRSRSPFPLRPRSDR